MLAPACPLCHAPVKSTGETIFCTALPCEWKSTSLSFVKTLLAYDVKSVDDEPKLHKFSSTQIDLRDAGRDVSFAPQILQMAASIPDEELAEDGRETNPHITIKFGIHTNDPEEVRRVVEGFGLIQYRLGKSSIFPASEKSPFDVIKIDVDSDDLHRLNELISSKLECTDTHPEYHPHVTLAYVKSGLGEKYAGKFDFGGSQNSTQNIFFSNKLREPTKISLMPAILNGLKSTGTCHQGERSDLTGCTPAMGEAGTPSNHTDLSSNKQSTDEPQEAEQKAQSILSAIASLSGRIIPQRMKNAAKRVKDKVVGAMTARYGERATGLILKVAALSAPVPVPGSQPIAIVTSLVIAEAILAYKKLRGGKAMEQELSEEEIHQAAEELVVMIQAELQKELDAPQVKPSPFANRKTLSASNESLGGALVPPPSLGPKRRKSPLSGRKSFVYYFGKAHQIGVPFQGPSGLWFVARPPNGKVVRAKNPNATGSTPATPTSPNAPVNSPAGTPPAASGTPVSPATPASGTPASSGASAAQQKIQNVLGPVYNKLVSNQMLTPAELAALPGMFAQLSSNDLRALNYILKNAGLMGLQHTQNRGPRLAALMTFAQGAGLAGVAIPAPPSVTSPVAPVTPPAPIVPPSPVAAPATPTPVSQPAPQPAAVSPLVLAPAAPAPVAPATPKKRTKKVSGSQADRDAVDDLVEAALKQLGVSTGKAVSDSTIQAKILQIIAPDVDGTVGYSQLHKSLQGLWTQLTTHSIPIQYGDSTPRSKNHNLPDEARPSLTSAEELAIQKYTGTAYRMLNKSLRDDGVPTVRTKQMHDDLQAAFAKTKEFKQPVRVVHGKNLTKATLNKLIAHCQSAENTGKPITFNQYISTSTNPSVNPRWNSDVEFVFNAVKGLDAKPFSHCPHANEIILDADSQFVVKSVKQVGGKWLVEMDQLRPSQVTNKPNGSTTASGKYKPPSNYVFAKPPGAAAPKTPKVKASKPHKFAGVKTSKTVADILTGTKTYNLHAGNFGGHEDKALTDIMTESGRAGKPKVLDKAGIDGLKTQGWKVFYRGVTDNKYTDQFRTGDLYNGSGCYGNGTYAQSDSVGDDRAKGVASTYAHGGPVMRMAMDPKAKIISYAGLTKKIQNYRAELSSELSKGNITTSEYNSLREITKDEGRFAALHNYDAIQATKSGYFVLLNRSILAVEDKDY